LTSRVAQAILRVIMDNHAPSSLPLQLLDLNRQELNDLLDGWGEPSYRSGQIWGWLHQKLVDDFGNMSNLPNNLRQRLSSETSCRPLELVTETISRDGLTHKCLFRLADGETIEAVLMSYDRGHTVCFSTQVGCPIRCPFCATGQSGLVRNLSAGEIVAQVLWYARSLAGNSATGGPSAQRATQQRVSRIVAMGMGEPLLNYDATWKALRILNDGSGLKLGARHMTVSTAGVVPGIDRMGEEGMQVGLAVSLHAATDRLRSQLVPLNNRYPLDELMTACKRYLRRSGRRITFEYALLQGINDSDQQAQHLARLLGGMLCHVNLIPVNRVSGSEYEPTATLRARSFRDVLRRRGLTATIRLRRGLDIDAGCGQLRNRASESG